MKGYNPYKEEMRTAHENSDRLPKQKGKTPEKPHTAEHQKIVSRITGLDHEIEFGPQGGGMVPKNPFASQAQQRYMYANPEVLGKKKLAEWSSKTDFKKLPKKVKK